MVCRMSMHNWGRRETGFEGRESGENEGVPERKVVLPRGRYEIGRAVLSMRRTGLVRFRCVIKGRRWVGTRLWSVGRIVVSETANCLNSMGDEPWSEESNIVVQLVHKVYGLRITSGASKVLSQPVKWDWTKCCSNWVYRGRVEDTVILNVLLSRVRGSWTDGEVRSSD